MTEDPVAYDAGRPLPVIPITDEELARGAAAGDARMEVGAVFFERVQARIGVHGSVLQLLMQAIESAGNIIMEDMQACRAAGMIDEHHWASPELHQRFVELQQALELLGQAAEAVGSAT
jgi:hypothetical protein